jgi:heme-degrading monooxygenase HmoA
VSGKTRGVREEAPYLERSRAWTDNVGTMTEHVLSVTSATLPPESEAGVAEAYRAATAILPHMVLNTVLVRGDANEWRIITLWRSREQLEAYRRSVDTPAAVKIFQDAGVEPTVTVYDVVHRAATQ